MSNNQVEFDSSRVHFVYMSGDLGDIFAFHSDDEADEAIEDWRSGAIDGEFHRLDQLIMSNSVVVAIGKS